MNQSNDLIDLVELSELAAVCARDLAEPIAQAGSMVLETLEQGGSLLFCGNGGSAADAQHLAAEYVIRFKRTRGPLRALALTTDTSVLTAGANDFGFVYVFARQVEALGREGDLLFLHFDVAPVPGQGRVQHFEGDDLSAIGVEGPVDGALAARGDLFEDLVTPYALFHGAYLKGLGLPSATRSTA